MGETDPGARVLVHSPVGDARMSAALGWLGARPRHAQVLIVASTLEAGRHLSRAAVAQGGSAFGWHCESLDTLAGALAALPLARAGLSPIGGFGVEALCARAVFELRARGELGRFAPVAELPGLSRALARTSSELAMAGVSASSAELNPDLARLYARYRELLDAAALADRAHVFGLSAQAVRAATQPPAGLPLLLWDVRVTTRAERELVAALAERAPACFATAPSLDAVALRNLEQALGLRRRPCTGDTAEVRGSGALRRLQRQLFAPPEETGALGDEIAILSAPGEARECVEIARRVLREAERGVAFDRMAILLRAPALYRAHLVEALRRARVPAYFTRGSVRPEPSGRALLALLACAAEKLSARRFAEYLSLGVVPRPSPSGAPPSAADSALAWVAPDDALLGVRASARDGARDALAPAAAWQDPELHEHAGEDGGVDSSQPGFALPAPRRWEQLLVDAAVIGSEARWRRRLDGLEQKLLIELHEERDEADERRLAIERELEALRALRSFALPLIEALAALPAQATWGEWISALSLLATRALAQPAAVLQGLAELAPMAPIGPVGLAEVRLVLERRFGEQLIEPADSAEGKLLVAAIDEARGMVFDVVFVPGLAERIFPPKLAEDPLLLDAARARLTDELQTKNDRVGDERCALQVAIGAARERLVVSYPRFAADRARPRVPSFYALEVLRAAEGELPGFGELARRATEACDARMGWPAPRAAGDAIDAAEYDLVVLSAFLNGGGDTHWSGAANYLLSVNPHLGRALRFRARRWHKKWHAADGLVNPGEAARAVLARNALSARAYSATALEKYAACPYRFYLAALVGLSPREQVAPIETLGGAERGALVHDVLRVFLTGMRDEGLLPLTAERRELAQARLDAVLDEVAARYRERLAPAIERVWQDGVAEVRADLRDLLLRAIEERAFVPSYFELGFGIRHGELDAASRPDAVALDCGLTLKGAIDLVERQPEGGSLRAVDYKTGAAPEASYVAIAGGRMLQPLLYAHVLAQWFPDAEVVCGQAYYCTAHGGFRRLEVPLDDRNRGRVRLLAETIGQAIERGFLPAAPDRDACEHCDYQAVCGPYEAQRAVHKERRALEALVALRREP